VVGVLRLGLAIAAAVAVADQLVKWWAITELAARPGGIEVLPFFNLVLVWNRGVSFGLLGGAALPPWLLAAFAGLVAIGLAVWLARASGGWLVVGIGLIIGGAVGNIVDRLRYGAVADFLDFHIGVYHWPAFNVADASITVGVVLLIIDSLLIRREGLR
jgi:signal peptidase II